MKDMHGIDVHEGDVVNCYPDPDNIATQDFTEVIRKIRTDTDGKFLATVTDMDANPCDFEEHELELCE